VVVIAAGVLARWPVVRAVLAIALAVLALVVPGSSLVALLVVSARTWRAGARREGAHAREPRTLARAPDRRR
jgi:hypothetical protein